MLISFALCSRQAGGAGTAVPAGRLLPVPARGQLRPLLPVRGRRRARAEGVCVPQTVRPAHTLV